MAKTKLKDKFTFGSIFNASVEEYEKNFKAILKFMLVFVGIPMLFFNLLEFLLIVSNPSLFSMFSMPSAIAQLGEGTLKIPLYYTLLLVLFGIITAFITTFAGVGLINASLKKSKFSFRELVKLGKVRYWRYILFGIVSGIFLVLLFLALIIPGIIFLVYWAFAVYIFMDKKLGIKKSLTESRKMLKHRWWKTFGYGILLILICIGIYIIFALITVPTSLIHSSHVKNNIDMSATFLGIQSLVSVIYNFIVALITTPLMLFFFKNFYLEVKKVYKEKKESKSKKRRK